MLHVLGWAVGMMKRHNKALGKVLRRLRKEAGKSQESLGFDAAVTRTYISLVELGRPNVSFDMIIVLCQALDVSFSHLASLVDAEMDSMDRDN